MIANSDTPEAQKPFIEGAIDRIQTEYGAKLDFSPDTLPFVDAYLRKIAEELSARDRAEAVEEMGCYFGEVLRRLLNGRWADEDNDPARWRIELLPCFLYFYPVGMAAEVVMHCESEDYDGSFATNKEMHQKLEEKIEELAPMSEDDYFSLCGRFDILQTVAEFLITQRLVSNEGNVDDIPASAYINHLHE